MANKEHLDILKQGKNEWNLWRSEYFGVIKPDLSEADLRKADLSIANLSDVDLSNANLSGADLNMADLSMAKFKMADLSNANLSEADLSWANLNKAKLSTANLSRANLSEASLSDADLSGANLSKANLSDVYFFRADLSGANLSGADLSEARLRGVELHRANLSGANLNGVDLSGADLKEANFSKANLTNAVLNGADLSWANFSWVNLGGAHLMYTRVIETNFEKSNLTGCRIYGISAWNLQLHGTIQSDLVITRYKEPTITVDNLEVAQFIYLLLNNEKIRGVIDTISSKVVLILGRFGEHKTILDAIRGELRKCNYLPVLFDFEKPVSRDITETVRTLAHLSRFIIADITEPRSIPQELQAIVPDLAVPIQPLLLEGSTGEYAMFQDLKKKYHWVLATYQYKDITLLLDSLGENVIAPAEAKARELEKR